MQAVTKTALILAQLHPGGWETVLILAVLLVLFGARKLPELARRLGKGMRDFRQAIR